MDGTDFSLYYAALRADTRYHEELVRVYGERGAGDARYNRVHTDDGVLEARENFHAASDAWRAEMRRTRADASAYPVSKEDL